MIPTMHGQMMQPDKFESVPRFVSCQLLYNAGYARKWR